MRDHYNVPPALSTARKKTRALLPLMDWIPAVSKRFIAPRHLERFVEVFEAIHRGEEQHAVCAVPPRHCKSETAKHAIAWLLLANPRLRIGYCTYGQTFSEKKSREIRDLYQRVGGHINAEAKSRRDWRTGVEEGGLWATSIGGPITGEGFDLLVIDDAVKDRATAESAIDREKVWAWYLDTAFTRLEPGGSEVAIGTRWHVEDFGGRLIRDDRMDKITLPAIDAMGRALCPERYGVEQLQKIRDVIGEYGWQSLYMGEPFSKGGALFKDANYYTELPAPITQMSVSIGCDFGYSTKKRADASVAVVLAHHEGVFYVVDVISARVEAPDFISRVKILQHTYPSAKTVAYIGGQEQGVIDTMRSVGGGFEIDSRRATLDKFTRAQPVAAAWCAKKVKLPEAEFFPSGFEKNDFVSEVVGFTGVGDRHDDCVDALSSAFDVEWSDYNAPSFVEAAKAWRASGGAVTNFD